MWPCDPVQWRPRGTRRACPSSRRLSWCLLPTPPGLRGRALAYWLLHVRLRDTQSFAKQRATAARFRMRLFCQRPTFGQTNRDPRGHGPDELVSWSVGRRKANSRSRLIAGRRAWEVTISFTTDSRELQASYFQFSVPGRDGSTFIFSLWSWAAAVRPAPSDNLNCCYPRCASRNRDDCTFRTCCHRSRHYHPLVTL